MKKCPYCAEEIQDDAINCRYCQSDLSSAKLESKVSPGEVPKMTEPLPTRPSPQQSKAFTPNIKMPDEEFISSLESTIKENKLNIIPLNELHEIYNHAKLIVSCSNKMDIEFSKAINALLGEIKKRGLTQGTRPQKNPNKEKNDADSFYWQVRLQAIWDEYWLVIIIIIIIIPVILFTVPHKANVNKMEGADYSGYEEYKQLVSQTPVAPSFLSKLMGAIPFRYDEESIQGHLYRYDRFNKTVQIRYGIDENSFKWKPTRWKNLQHARDVRTRGMIVGGPMNGSIMPGRDGGMIVGGPMNGSIMPGRDGDD